ncbi:hypothetical protein AB0H83_15830 [Dactylosporangium sp. NPDC050688]|uniref:hypothetical protein n=1 Tax=Dactylosporangium sp. NPDC050688 TaxID=3157217 RepID=UPI0033C0EB89
MSRPEEPEKPAFALPAPVPADPPPFAVPPPPPGYGPPPAAQSVPPGGQPVAPGGQQPVPPQFAPPPPSQPPGPPQFAPPPGPPQFTPPQFAPPAGEPALGVPPAQPATGTPAAPSPGGLKKGWLWGFLALAVVVCGVSCVGALEDSGTGVDTPAAAHQQSVVDGLARATAAHGICYGWRLQSSASTVNVGSNLGVGKAVTDDPAKCAKYVEVQGNVRYYPGDSESEDTAAYTIRSTLGDTGRLDPAAFGRLGAGTERLLEDPATTILVVADALPLLTQEAGLAPTPVPLPSATGSVAPVATGGSDFLRDRWVLLGLSGGLLLVAVVALFLGRRASRRSAQPPPAAAPPLPGSPPSGSPLPGSPLPGSPSP